MPDHEPPLAAAQTAFSDGRLDEALSLANGVLARDPTNWIAKHLRAVIRAKQGDARMLTALVENYPDSFEALISLATFYRDAGEIDAAAAIGYRAVKLRPDAGTAHFEFGVTWLAGGRPDRAVVALTRAAEFMPSFAPAFGLLGRTWQALENHPEAAKAYRRAAELVPTLEAYLGLARSLNKTSDFAAAADAARSALAISPSSAGAHLALAAALFGLESFSEGNDHLRQAIELDHEGSESFAIGLVQRVAGDLEGSNASFRRAIAFDPTQPQPYAVLVHNSKITEDDRHLVDKMRRLTQAPELSIADKGGLHYGLGKALEDLGDYREAMLEYDEANKIARATKLGDRSIDLDEIRRRTDLLIRLATPSRVEGATGSDLPILIVGMMRSGTTLAEQIISSHPRVSAAGEQPFWMKNWTRAVEGGALNPAALAAAGKEYVEELRRLWPQADRVTDKMPSNYLVAYLVHLALPNARIVHLRRNPADNALSIWTTPNQPVSDGGHDKRNLVAVFKEYQRLMAHLRSVMPSDRFLEIEYEDLVSRQEPVTRQMIAFCGLEWDDDCLQPERNPRPVLTPSVWQVRQPVYKSSVARWRKFEPWLGPFKELLTDNTLGVASTAQIATANDSATEHRQPGANERLGNQLKIQGRFDEATEAYEAALRENPARKGLLYDLVTCRKITPADQPLIERLEQAAQDTNSTDEERVRLHFGLGKAYEDLGRYEEAMCQFDAGHNVQNHPFDQKELAARFDSIIQTLSKERISAAKDASTSELPLLVMGIVRSGTTLVEQILACHSQVAAGGELSFWPENWQRSRPAAQYLEILRKIGPSAKRVTDKMPGNTIALGAIHRALPNARAIVCRRNPLDTAISIYTTPIQTAHTWIHRKEDIVFYFRQHQRLMNHWREVLPQNAFMELSYEELIRDPERVTRELLHYAGLEWEDACLRPQDNPRAVLTPSMWQVRQPLYATSVERWRRFEPWLGALADLK